MEERGPMIKALAKAQSEMGKALKSAENKHFKNRYAELSDVITACLPALNSNGFSLTQPYVSSEHGAAIRTTLSHESGHEFHCDIPLLIGKQDMQGLGSAMTYARRYGLMSLAGLAPEDDDGNDAAKSLPTEKPKPAPVDETAVSDAIDDIEACQSVEALIEVWKQLNRFVAADPRVTGAKDNQKAMLTEAE